MTYDHHVSLSSLSTFRLGGPAKYVTRVTTIKELITSISWARSRTLPFFILGGGSNVIFPDSGFPGLIIIISLRGIEINKKDAYLEIVVGAGEDWDAFVENIVRQGFYGIENLSGIPGTVGATPIQNVGAYGSEVKNVIEWVEVFHMDTSLITRLTNRECKFDYRNSVFKKPEGQRYIVTKVCFRLQEKGTLNTQYEDVALHFAQKRLLAPTIEDMRGAILSIRSQKFPNLESVGTAGSFFKNPVISLDHAQKLRRKYPSLQAYSFGKNDVKVSLAWVLDTVCGLKGVRTEHFGTYEKQPLVIVHYGGGTTEELKTFVHNIQNTVKEKTNIDIIPEVLLL